MAQQTSSIAQASGALGVARKIDPELKQPLVYRLVALDQNTVWGKGRLVQLVEKCEKSTDAELSRELYELLKKPWQDDPTRSRILRQRNIITANQGAGDASSDTPRRGNPSASRFALTSPDNKASRPSGDGRERERRHAIQFPAPSSDSKAPRVASGG